MEEKIYTIPLLRAKMAPRTKRAKKAVRLVKEFLAKHTKAEVIKIDKSVNEAIWARGLRKVPSKIRVKAVKIEDEIWAYTPEAEVKIEKEKLPPEETKEEVKEVEEEVKEEQPEEIKEEKKETEEETKEEVEEEVKEIEGEKKEELTEETKEKQPEEEIKEEVEVEKENENIEEKKVEEGEELKEEKEEK